MIGTIAITSQFGSAHGRTHEHQKDRQEHETHKYPPAPPLARPPSIFQRLKSTIFFWNRSQEQPAWPTAMKAPEMETHQHHTFQDPEHEQMEEQGPEQEQEQEQENPSHFARSPSTPQKPEPSGLYSHIVIEPTAPPTPTPPGNVNYPNLKPFTPYNFRQEQARAQELQGEEDDRAEEAESEAATNRLPRTTVRRSASMKYPILHIDEDDEEEDGDFLERRRPASAREGTGKINGRADEEVDARADDFINKFKHQLKLQRMESITRQN